MKHKFLGELPSSTTIIPNSGVTKLAVATTYTLAQPEVGCLKTIYRTASLTTANTSIAPSSGVSFNSAGGTQVLVLRPSTVGGEDTSVTLIGESTAQWRILSAWPKISPDTTTPGVAVTT